MDIMDNSGDCWGVGDGWVEVVEGIQEIKDDGKIKLNLTMYNNTGKGLI